MHSLPAGLGAFDTFLKLFRFVLFALKHTGGSVTAGASWPVDPVGVNTHSKAGEDDAHHQIEEDEQFADEGHRGILLCGVDSTFSKPRMSRSRLRFSFVVFST